MSSLDAGASGSVGNVGAADDRPLTQQEYQLLQRLLSDPFSLPLQFKTWLVSYLETSDMNLPISAVNGLSGMLGISTAGEGTLGLLPAGIILPFGGDAAPTGAKMCDGANYTKAAEARLYAAIGDRYAVGRPAPPAGTFYVPDFTDRTLYGKGNAALTNQVGKTDGVAAGSRFGPAHHHHFNKGIGVSGGTDSVGDHTHGYVGPVIGDTVMQGTAGPAHNVNNGLTGGFVSNGAGGHSHGVSASGTVDGDTTGGGQQDAGNFGVVSFIIIA